jgi:RNA polymerase sigma factor, sigma-70 family
MHNFLLSINQYRDKLVNHAYYRLGDLDEAEDIVQEVFVKVYSRRLFSKLDNIEHYLYKMTMNACLDFIRKQQVKLRMQQYFEGESENCLENEAINKFQMKEEFIKINNLLQKLPDEQAEVVRFRIIDELSFKEIAAILERPESTVKSRFQYAINKLKNYEL